MSTPLTMYDLFIALTDLSLSMFLTLIAQSPARTWRINLSFFSDNFESPANDKVPQYSREESSTLWELSNARRIPPAVNGHSNYLSVAKELLGADFSGFVDLLRRFQDPKEEFLFDDMYKAIGTNTYTPP